jgi:glycosyltransferase involved in cell wall biosynthesis
MDKSPEPLISIITVVLNGAKTIEQTIQSVIQQPYQKKEYIIIDGGSTDGTIEIIKKYQPWLTYWISERDKGIYEAMNKGIRMSKGDLIGIINADDWYEENIFSTIAEQYCETGSDQVIYGLLRVFKDEAFYSMVGNSIRTLNKENIMHPTCFIPGSFYKSFGKYNLSYKYCADYELILRYVNRGVKFSFLEKPIANFRKGGASSRVGAEREKYNILTKYHKISKIEYFMRIFQIEIAWILKNFIK